MGVFVGLATISCVGGIVLVAVGSEVDVGKGVGVSDGMGVADGRSATSVATSATSGTWVGVGSETAVHAAKINKTNKPATSHRHFVMTHLLFKKFNVINDTRLPLKITKNHHHIGD
jgi:hypothetical protein